MTTAVRWLLGKPFSTLSEGTLTGMNDLADDQEHINLCLLTAFAR